MNIYDGFLLAQEEYLGCYRKKNVLGKPMKPTKDLSLTAETSWNPRARNFLTT